jgi:DNA-binding transcriptional ArsR family regulator
MNLANYCAVGSGACFDALADNTRRRVVELLSDGPQRAGKLAESTGTTPATMSRHLRVLLEHGLVQDERVADDARVRIFRLRREPFADLQAWLDQVQAHWTEQLGSFKRHADRQVQ